MPSIVDTIAKTEAEADEIRAEAQKKARSIISVADADVEAEIMAASQEVRKSLVLRRENANHTADKLRDDILANNKKESENDRMAAEAHVDKAAKYIIERLSV